MADAMSQEELAMRTQQYAIWFVREALALLGKIDITDLPPELYEPVGIAARALHDGLRKMDEDDGFYGPKD